MQDVRVKKFLFQSIKTVGEIFDFKTVTKSMRDIDLS